MGEELTRRDGQTRGVIIQEDGGTGGEGTSGKSSGAASTRTETGESGRTGRRTGNGTDTEGKTGEEKQFSELALLTDEERAAYMTADETEKKRLMRNAKKRERYRQQKENGGQTVKPRKVKQKKQEQSSIDVTQLNMIIAGISAAVASRPNCEQWLLTEGEINSITTPLSRMMAESEMFANVGQYSNQIALVMACITVFAPRLLITAQKQKEGKKRARTGQQTNTNVTDGRVTGTGRNSEPEKKSNPKSNRGNDKGTPANGGVNADTVPFYGLPIC